MVVVVVVVMRCDDGGSGTGDEMVLVVVHPVINMMFRDGVFEVSCFGFISLAVVVC